MKSSFYGSVEFVQNQGHIEILVVIYVNKHGCLASSRRSIAQKWHLNPLFSLSSESMGARGVLKSQCFLGAYLFCLLNRALRPRSIAAAMPGETTKDQGSEPSY
jgi:hypothetical protein